MLDADNVANCHELYSSEDLTQGKHLIHKFDNENEVCDSTAEEAITLLSVDVVDSMLAGSGWESVSFTKCHTLLDSWFKTSSKVAVSPSLVRKSGLQLLLTAKWWLVKDPFTCWSVVVANENEWTADWWNVALALELWAATLILTASSRIFRDKASRCPEFVVQWRNGWSLWIVDVDEDIFQKKKKSCTDTMLKMADWRKLGGQS